MSTARSAGLSAVGFSNGSVSLWSKDALSTALEAAEEALRIALEAAEEARMAERVPVQEGSPPPSHRASSDGSPRDEGEVQQQQQQQGPDYEADASVDGVVQECVDSLPFISRWDSKTGRFKMCSKYNPWLAEARNYLYEQVSPPLHSAPTSDRPLSLLPGQKVQALKHRRAEIPPVCMLYSPDGLTVSL